jgi:spermidine synthase
VDLRVVVGGLGLGYTAQAVLSDPRVGDLIVVEAVAEVIAWHQRGLVPCGAQLTEDPRCRMVHGDFFALANSIDGFDPHAPGRRVHAVLADIDHAPRHWLHPSHGAFYTAAGLAQMATHLLPDGVFALWSNDPPDAQFTGLLRKVFTSADAHVVSFPNPLQDRDAANTIYVASVPRPRLA